MNIYIMLQKGFYTVFKTNTQDGYKNINDLEQTFRTTKTIYDQMRQQRAKRG